MATLNQLSLWNKFLLSIKGPAKIKGYTYCQSNFDFARAKYCFQGLNAFNWANTQILEDVNGSSVCCSSHILSLYLSKLQIARLIAQLLWFFNISSRCISHSDNILQCLWDIQIATHIDRVVSSIRRKPLKVLVQVNTSGEACEWCSFHKCIKEIVWAETQDQ